MHKRVWNLRKAITASNDACFRRHAREEIAEINDRLAECFALEIREKEVLENERWQDVA